MLLEQVAEGLICQVLQRLHAVEREFVKRVPGLSIEFNAPAYRTVGSRMLCHQLAFFARFFAGAASAAARFPTVFSGLALPPPTSILRRSASIRLTTLAGRAAGFSFGAGKPACFERMSSIIAFS